MPTRALTAAVVERIKPPASGQIEFFDQGYPGLALRVSYGGAKTFVYFYRSYGKLKRMTLGRAPAMSLAEAREAWRIARNAIERGEAPKAPKKTAAEIEADSFAAIADEWVRRDQKKNRTVGEVNRVLERDVKPKWGHRPIVSISRRDVIELIDAVADRGASTQARRLHSYLHRLFRWSVGRGIIPLNPMSDLPKIGAEVRRDRVLDDAELAAVWGAADVIGWPFGPAVKLLILTGARKSEIGDLRYSEVRDGIVSLTGSRTKNGEPHRIPLSALAREIIAEVPRIDDSDFAFTTTGNTPVSGWTKPKMLIDQKAAEILGRPLEPWRIHDLRRTVATGLQRLGCSLQVIEAVLGHTAGSRAGIVGIYQRHSFDPEKAAALEAWGRHVDRLINPAQSNVVELRVNA